MKHVSGSNAFDTIQSYMGTLKQSCFSVGKCGQHTRLVFEQSVFVTCPYISSQETLI